MHIRKRLSAGSSARQPPYLPSIASHRSLNPLELSFADLTENFQLSVPTSAFSVSLFREASPIHQRQDEARRVGAERLVLVGTARPSRSIR